MGGASVAVMSPPRSACSPDRLYRRAVHAAETGKRNWRLLRRGPEAWHPRARPPWSRTPPPGASSRNQGSAPPFSTPVSARTYPGRYRLVDPAWNCRPSRRRASVNGPTPWPMPPLRHHRPLGNRCARRMEPVSRRGRRRGDRDHRARPRVRRPGRRGGPRARPRGPRRPAPPARPRVRRRAERRRASGDTAYGRQPAPDPLGAGAHRRRAFAPATAFSYNFLMSAPK